MRNAVRAISVGGAAAVIVSLWLPWFEPRRAVLGASEAPATFSGFEGWRHVDILMVVLSAMVCVAVAVDLAARGRYLAVAGPAGLLLLGVVGASAWESSDLLSGSGVWVGLAGAVAASAAGWMSTVDLLKMLRREDAS